MIVKLVGLLFELVGLEIKENVCQACWNEWSHPGGVKTMVINEYHLNLGDENGRETLKKQMRAFFKLPDASAEFKDYRHS